MEWKPRDPRDAAVEALPLPEIARRRIRMTIGCADCEDLPKVARAGGVFEGPGGRYQLMHNGVKVVEDGYCGRWMTELIRLLRGHHEPQEERAFAEVLRHVPAGATMVELGSYWAYYSLWFLHQVPGSKAYLIEPDPNHLEVGRRNFALNGREGTFLHASVGRRSRPPEPFPCESDGVGRPVPMTSVDDLLDRVGRPRVEVLLSDIQGGELDMLEGAAGSVERGLIRFMVISTHHHSISGNPLTHQECLGWIRDRGAHVLAEHSVVESFSGDGLIVASFRPEDRDLPPIRVSRNYPTNSFFRALEYDLHDAWQEIRRLKQAVA